MKYVICDFAFFTMQIKLTHINHFLNGPLPARSLKRGYETKVGTGIWRTVSILTQPCLMSVSQLETHFFGKFQSSLHSAWCQVSWARSILIYLVNAFVINQLKIFTHWLIYAGHFIRSSFAIYCISIVLIHPTNSKTWQKGANTLTSLTFHNL